MTKNPVDYDTAKELLNKLALRNAVIRDWRLAGEMAELDHLLTVLQPEKRRSHTYLHFPTASSSRR
jgi:hypothetical protein